MQRPEKFARGLSSPVVAGHSDAVVEAEAEGGARRLNGVVALKGKRIKAHGYAEAYAKSSTIFSKQVHLFREATLHLPHIPVLKQSYKLKCF